MTTKNKTGTKKPQKPNGDFNTKHYPILEKGAVAVNELLYGIIPAKKVRGVSASGKYFKDREMVLKTIAEVLTESGRVYQREGTVVFAEPDNKLGADTTLVSVAAAGEALTGAAERLANVVVQETATYNAASAKDFEIPPYTRETSALPEKVVQELLVSDVLRGMLPRIDQCYKHGVFDRNLIWINSGYHEDGKIAVLADGGEPIDIDLSELPGPLTENPTVKDVLDRLPPHCAELLHEFPWKTGLDLINFFGMLVLIPMLPYVRGQRLPGMCIWGNKPSLGKTLLASVLGVLRDGIEAEAFQYQVSPDKRDGEFASMFIVAPKSSVVLIDNLKGKLSDADLESKMTQSVVSARRYHTQTRVERTNDLFWVFTSNDAEPDKDMLTRLLSIELFYEGNSEDRPLERNEGELIDYAKTNRGRIIAELAGLSKVWQKAGCPMIEVPGRQREVLSLIGSILKANELPGFASNQREITANRSGDHQVLISLLEAMMKKYPNAIIDSDAEIQEFAKEMQSHPEKRPAEVLSQAHFIPELVLLKEIDDQKTERQRKKEATTFLDANVSVVVQTDTEGVLSESAIVGVSVGARKKGYLFKRKVIDSSSTQNSPQEGPSAMIVPESCANEAPETGNLTPICTVLAPNDPEKGCFEGVETLPIDDFWPQ